MKIAEFEVNSHLEDARAGASHRPPVLQGEAGRPPCPLHLQPLEAAVVHPPLGQRNVGRPTAQLVLQLDAAVLQAHGDEISAVARRLLLALVEQQAVRLERGEGEEDCLLGGVVREEGAAQLQEAVPAEPEAPNAGDLNGWKENSLVYSDTCMYVFSQVFE